jgi:DNA mismatch endonuclease (patch repair protein)
MRATKRRDTRPELALRSELHARGFRYRVDERVWSGRGAPRPDLIFKREKVAVFIDGCFWHSCPDHCRPPTTNLDYWEPKLARNRERDLQNNAALAADGWLVVRIWEHVPTEEAAEMVARAVRSRREGEELG